MKTNDHILIFPVSVIICIYYTNIIDIQLTENPFYFSRTAQVVVTNSHVSQRVRVFL